MGVKRILRTFYWYYVQNANYKDKAPADWDWNNFDRYVGPANHYGKEILGILGYGVDWVHTIPGGCLDTSWGDRKLCTPEEIAAFCTYARETVKRYNGKNGHGTVHAWLIWNEPDIPRFWGGSPDEFFVFNKAVAKTIRELDEEEQTETVLVSGVFTALVSQSWIDGFFAHSGIDDYNLDLAFHPYSPRPQASLNMFNAFRQKAEAHGFRRSIWINEMGYPTYPERGGIPRGRQGTDQYEGNMPDVAVKTFTLFAASGAHSLTWYNMFDGPDRDIGESEDWFGLAWRKSNTEWVRKGGYWGYAIAANNIPGKTHRQMDLPATIPSYIEPHYFEGIDGSRTLVVWNNSPLETVAVQLTLPGRNHKLWNPETGRPAAIGRTSTHILHPINKYRRTLAFITWAE
jgi:hypothetical protein